MVAFLPDGIRRSQYSTFFPIDEHLEGYYVCKWRLGEYLSRIAEMWSGAEVPSETGKGVFDGRS